MSMDASGIRKVFDLGATLADPINLSIGQPDFPVPEPMRAAAIKAIEDGHNGYTVTQGIPPLQEAIWAHLGETIGWDGPTSDLGLLVTSGTSGGLLLAAMALLDPGDEMIIGDPYFVMYPQLGPLTGASMVTCPTYPDFRMTAERIEPLITERTKAILLNSPSNPSGVVLGTSDLAEIVQLCHDRGVMLISDEIYDEFTFPDAHEDGVFPSPARLTRELLLVRGFGKTYGCTGWRMGYVAGPSWLINQMAKLQQYTYVCPPSMAQWGVIPSFGLEIDDVLQEYACRRDIVVNSLEPVTRVVRPGGAFYCFIELPQQLGQTATEFAERAVRHNVLTIPGSVFSERDTHLRVSFAVDREKLQAGMEILSELMRDPNA